jgi:hypothetical protein
MPVSKSSVSKVGNYEAIGEFWDDHDFTEFDDPLRPDAAFEIRDTIRIEAELLAAIERVAASSGVSTETLINLWLQERLQSISAE